MTTIEQPATLAARPLERVVRPRLLDLFCCAGGAAMGYAKAGFDVVGVDINPPAYTEFLGRQLLAATKRPNV